MDGELPTTTRPLGPSPAWLEKLGTAAIAVLSAATRRAIVWSVLGLMFGLVVDLGGYGVARRVAHGSMPIATTWVIVASVAIPALAAALFALYGAQLGAVQAGLEAEREVGLLGSAARSGLVVVESRFGASFRGASRDAVDDAIEEGSLHLLGRAPATWKGLWGFVARQTYRALARRFEVALIAAHLEVSVEAGESGDVTVTRIAERGRDLLARSLGDLANLVLGVELVALVVGLLLVGLGWYPLAARFVSVVPM